MLFLLGLCFFVCKQGLLGERGLTVPPYESVSLATKAGMGWESYGSHLGGIQTTGDWLL